MIDTDPKALRVRDEIFLVDLNGDIKQSTYLPNKYAGKISFPTWSPDGQYIAFWVSTDYIHIQSGNLAILDTLTSRVTLYCLQANPFPFRFGEDYRLGYQSTQVNGAPPIWSPDSKS